MLTPSGTATISVLITYPDDGRGHGSSEVE